MHFLLYGGGDFFTQAFFCARIIPALGTVGPACFVDTPGGRVLVVGDLPTISAALALMGSTVVTFATPGGGTMGLTAQIICGMLAVPGSSPACTYVEQVAMGRTVVLGTPRQVATAFGIP